jgi:hypothetical protein
VSMCETLGHQPELSSTTTMICSRKNRWVGLVYCTIYVQLLSLIHCSNNAGFSGLASTNSRNLGRFHHRIRPKGISPMNMFAGWHATHKLSLLIQCQWWNDHQMWVFL